MSLVGGEQVGYQYVVMRCVPRVDREEFVNVAVVLYCQRVEYIGFGDGIDADRLTALWPAVDVTAVQSALDTIAAICAGDEAGGPPARTGASARFGFLAAPRSTVVQPGPIHGGLLSRTADGISVPPEAETAALVNRLVRVPTTTSAE